MAIYLIQHGKAVDKEIDPDRPLSKEGKEEVERVSRYLRTLGLKVNKIYHSGKTRAVQTARILSEHICDGVTQELSGMGPNDDVVEFTKTIDKNEACYIGHLPHMAKLCGYLTTGKITEEVVSFTNSGITCLDECGAGWKIKWVLVPSMCV